MRVFIYSNNSRFSIFNYQLLAIIFAFLLTSCADPPFKLHERLEKTLQDDLENMVAQAIKSSGRKNVLDTPYFVIKDLREFRGDTARVYSAYAEVDFYYFNVKIAEKRKFRYDAQRHYWDRYFKKLFHY